MYVTEVVADEVSFAGNKGDSNNEPRVSVPPMANGNNYVPNAYGGNMAEFQPLDTHRTEICLFEPCEAKF